jgi:hypothetical protein
MKKFIHLVKNSVIVLGIAAGFSLGVSEAQTPAYYAGNVQYMSGNLLDTNFALLGIPGTVGLTTNFVSQNYFVSPNPDVVEMGNGVFPISPAAQWIYFQAYIQQCAPQGLSGQPNAGFSVTNTAFGPPQANSNTVLNATFVPIMDDKSLQFLGPVFTLTNLQIAATGSLTVNSLSTNAGGVLATFQMPATNFLGAKYAKIIGISGNFTNTLWFRGGLRWGEWGPAK